MYRILYVNGPVFEEPNLRAARKFVERYTPLKKGWSATWYNDKRRGQHFYFVRNSKGGWVQTVYVSIIKKGK